MPEENKPAKEKLVKVKIKRRVTMDDKDGNLVKIKPEFSDKGRPLTEVEVTEAVADAWSENGVI